MILQLSYICNGISCTGKRKSLYWIKAQQCENVSVLFIIISLGCSLLQYTNLFIVD